MTQQPLIEFKGSTVPTLIITLRTLDPASLDTAAQSLFGDSGFFDGDTGILDLSLVATEQSTDWHALQNCFQQHGLKLIGVRGGNTNLHTSALTAGLSIFPDAIIRNQRSNPAIEPSTTPDPVPPPTHLETATQQELFTPASPKPAALIVDRPLRSGQRIYAQDRDLVILAAVNPGAEVIADGNIHIYAPLRGRALAGASGDVDARIFTTRFEAELVSVAGVYRTFESGVPEPFITNPVQVKLSPEPATLILEPLKVD